MMFRNHPIFGFTGLAVTCRFSKSTSSASQATTQQQVGAETGETGGDVAIAGAGATGTNSSGLVLSHANILGTGANEGTINITDSDPSVAEAAISGVTVANESANTLSASALISNESISEAALHDVGAVAAGAEQVAAASIAAGVTMTGENDAFGEAALEAAENAQASSTTALESTAAEAEAGTSQAADNAQTLANNAISGTSQPINQAALPTAADETSSDGGLSTVGWWVTIIAGLLAVFYYFKKGKAA